MERDAALGPGRPQDEHERELVANTHPPDWRNPEPAARYNLVVLGAGTAGLVSAAGAALLGARVALVERDLLGGDCLVTGCVPSKTLIRSARATASLRQAGRYGVGTPDPARVDFARVMERVRAVRARISAHDALSRFAEMGVDVFLGEGRFVAPDALEVDGRRLAFRRAVVATGSRPAVPPVPGLAASGFLTNDTVFDLTELPQRLLVLGGGPVGVELAQAFARLGSRVILVGRNARLLPREEADAGAVVRRALERDGVELGLGASLAAIDPRPGGVRRAHLLHNGERRSVEVERVLVAAGRVPNVAGLGLEAAGVRFDEKQGVVVDDFLRSSNLRIFAAGDVCLPHKFTHAADAAARIVLQNALFPGPKRRFSRLVVPWCTYTDPELAHVGLGRAEARARGLEPREIRVGLADVDRAITDGEEEGFVQLLLHPARDRILGATIVGAHAGEMIGEITLAMVARAGLGTLGETIHPYPTRAEALRRAADRHRRSRLGPRTAWALGRWFAWTR